MGTSFVEAVNTKLTLQRTREHEMFQCRTDMVESFISTYLKDIEDDLVAHVASISFIPYDIVEARCRKDITPFFNEWFDIFTDASSTILQYDLGHALTNHLHVDFTRCSIIVEEKSRVFMDIKVIYTVTAHQPTHK
jgi:hypothetical protein